MKALKRHKNSPGPGTYTPNLASQNLKSSFSKVRFMRKIHRMQESV